MKWNGRITHEFVDTVPAAREEGKVYVSMKYASAVHSCFCGCGTKVVTPISPTGWNLTFDGDTVSFNPSNRQLGLCLPIALLDKARSGRLGKANVEGSN